LLDGILDLGFVFDPPKTPQLLVKQLMPIPLIMVASESGLTVEQAMDEDYIYIDWGNSFAMTHARLYPDIPAPRLRAGFGTIALTFLKTSGGAAYLPEAMAAQYMGEVLFRVEDAQVIHKDAFAIYAQTSGKREAIENALLWFDKEHQSQSE
jgi:DNA-binding transcriptional LysR family regulator